MGGNKEPLPGLFNWPITGCRTLAPGPAQWPSSHSSSLYLLPQSTQHPSAAPVLGDGEAEDRAGKGRLLPREGQAAPYLEASNLCRRCPGGSLLQLLLQPVHFKIPLCSWNIQLFYFLSFQPRLSKLFLVLNLMLMLANKSWKANSCLEHGLLILY